MRLWDAEPLGLAIWLGVGVVPMLTTCVGDPVGERRCDADCVELGVAAGDGVPLAVLLGEAVGDHVCD